MKNIFIVELEINFQLLFSLEQPIGICMLELIMHLSKLVLSVVLEASIQSHRFLSRVH